MIGKGRSMSEKGRSRSGKGRSRSGRGWSMICRGQSRRRKRRSFFFLSRLSPKINLLNPHVLEQLVQETEKLFVLERRN